MQSLSGHPAGTLGGGGGAAGRPRQALPRPAWWAPGSLCREPSASYRGGAGGARVPRRGSAPQAVSRLSHEDLPSQAGSPCSWEKSPHLYRISWGPALAEGLILPNSLTVPSIYDDGESRGADFGGGCPRPPGGLSGSQEGLTAQEPRASGGPTRGRRGCRLDLPSWVLGSPDW